MNNRKSLIIINGTLGVGKSSISKEIQSKLNNSVLIEGDLLSRKVRNFDVYDESKIFEVLTIIREEAIRLLRSDNNVVIVDYVFENQSHMNHLVENFKNVDEIRPFYISANVSSIENRIKNRDRDLKGWEFKRSEEILSVQRKFLTDLSLGAEVCTNGKMASEVADEIITRLDYRPNVAAFVLNRKNEILFCHRRDVTSNQEGFQVPQGGIENGEFPIDALRRELEEEICLVDFRIIGNMNNGVRYRWHGQNVESPYLGQEQVYFLVQVDKTGESQIKATKDFDSYKWVDGKTILNEVIEFKKIVYEAALAELEPKFPEFFFKPLEESDMRFVRTWLQAPHVKEFWDDGGSWEESYEKYVLRTSSDIVKQFIVYYQNKPIGYIQFYWAGKVGDGWWEGYSDTVVGIDQYIGDGSFIEKGVGTKMIKEFINLIEKNHKVDKIITDPAPTNLRAIRCYEKVGFNRAGEVDTPDGKAILM